MKRRIITLVVLLFLFGVVSAEAQEKVLLNRDEVIRLVLTENEEIAMLEEDLNIAKARLEGARANFFPNIDLSTVYTRLGETPEVPDFSGGGFSIEEGSKNSYSFNLGFQQPLYTGGQISTGYEQAKVGVQTAKLQMEERIEELKESALNQYYGLLRAQKMVELMEQTSEQIERYVQIAQTNKEVGIFTNTDVLQARVNLGQAKQGLLRAENGFELAQAALKNTLGLASKVEVELEEELDFELVEIDKGEITEYAFANRIDLKLLDAQEELLKLSLKRSKGSRRPTLSLAGDYSTRDDSLTFSDGEWNINLALSYNIFDGGSKRSGIKEAQSELDKALLRRDQIEKGIKLQLKESLLNIDEAADRIELMDLSLKEARENLRQSELQYKEGLLSSFDILQAQTVLKEVKTDYYQAIYDYNLALINLDKVIGRPVNYKGVE
ncbi:TolC family protein [Halonatronum saccharophilum]|uniref:TolC family protein n=1 Tax=Halonatronum saccharophilum TaxID=150060 RepID=UPI0004871DBD|nr:TolC family protein [Halonatronum saccharophilum]